MSGGRALHVARGARVVWLRSSCSCRGGRARCSPGRGHVTAVRTRRSRRVVAPAHPLLAARRRAAARRRPPGSILEQRDRRECAPQTRRRRGRASIAGARGASRARGAAASRWCRGATRRIRRALAAIADPPPVLWARGNLAALSRPAVAIVGSRARLAVRAERRGAPRRPISRRAASSIVSGLARGVDSAAHRGALAANGSTLGRARLRRRRRSIRPSIATSRARIEADGAVLSELVPGTPPRKPFFPLRNRDHQRAVARGADRRSRARRAGRSSRRGARSSRDAKCWPFPATS